MAVLRECLEDRKRKQPTEDELKEFTWHFRFKEMAGDAWTARDPWWNDEPPAKVWFRSGGVVEREPIMEGITISWQWGEQPASLKCIVNGRGVPTYMFGRHPTHGGFFMHSCWALYTAFPMEPKGEDPYMADEALNLTAEEQMDEVMEYNSEGAVARLRVGPNLVIEIPPPLVALLRSVPAENQQQVIEQLIQRAAWEDHASEQAHDDNIGGYTG